MSVPDGGELPGDQAGLAGRRIVVIEPMSSGVAVLRSARELGLENVVLSYDEGDRRLSGALRDLADRLVKLDTNDEGAVISAVDALNAERPVLGIMPGFEFYVPTVARVAERLGLPGLSARHIERVRNKAEMMRLVRQAGPAVPRYALVESYDQLAEAAAQVGFPCVAKPVDSAGSVHVTRADTTEQLREAYRWMCDDERLDLGRRAGDRMLVTSYLEGPEFSVEGYVSDRQVRTVSITAKMLGPEPHFVETGHIVQAGLPDHVRSSIENFVADVVRALDITLGPFHCELRLVKNEPVLIEIGVRLAGDHIVDLVDLATGTSLARVMLALHTGLSFASVGVQRAPQAKCAGIRFFTAPDGMRSYRQARGLDEARAMVGVTELELDIDAGDPIPPAEDFRCRLGHAIFTADSYLEATERWRLLGEAVRFVN
ncbi:MAG TPA: ATP-grasp domain-containing protein [Streptosporangiaceae bacterium]|nr:ATP-grasp domain-containing protein [Streptosporangiaceae bacterium]